MEQSLKSACFTLLLILPLCHSSAILNGTGVFETVSCQAEEAYGSTDITLSAESPITRNEIPIMHILFDKTTKVPITSTVIFDDWNERVGANPTRNYRKVQNSASCPDIFSHQQDCHITSGGFPFTDAQSQKNGGQCKGWNKGHLTPIDPMRFTQDASDSTNLCINIAPQEPFTNRGPWRVVESTVKEAGIEKHGIVMTGTCGNSNSLDGSYTKNNEWIPACWWKLFCYKDGQQTKVVGFYAPNSLIDYRNQDAEKEQRRTVTRTPRTQREIWNLAETDQRFFQVAWLKSLQLVEERTNNLPDVFACAQTANFDDDVRREWEQRVSVQEKLLACDEENCEDCDEPN